MSSDGKLMDMLTGYAAAHQHPFNVFVHLIGIPTILLGVLIPLSWVEFVIGAMHVSLAHILVTGFTLFYLTLDRLFAFTFLVMALLLAAIATRIGALPLATSGAIAAAAFFGGYVLQFVGHAVEKSLPVLVKHPIQANLAAPFFTVVELFHLAGLRADLFEEVQLRIRAQRSAEQQASQGSS